MKSPAMQQLLNLTKALSDQARIRIICALHAHGELCVCQVQELLGLAASTTSKHLHLLTSAGLAAVRRRGKWAYYRLAARAEMPEHGATVVAWLIRQAAPQQAIARDRAKLKRILTCSPEELCQRQAAVRKCCSSAPATPAAARWPKATRARSRAK